MSSNIPIRRRWPSRPASETPTSRPRRSSRSRARRNRSITGTASRRRIAMMATYLRPEAFAFLLAIAFGSQLARADVYTWVDASGATNVSNVSPPEGVRVTRVTHENPQKAVRPDPAARDATHDAEIQALSERIQQLQHEVELARTYAPPLPQPMAYPAMPPAPAPAYAADAMPAPTSSCDPSFGGCGYWWGQPGYPASVVV